jgi:hypothetical protein
MKQNMFKTILVASVVTVSGAVLPACAAETLHVSVPFSFTAGNAKMAAGDYSISQSENGMVTLSGTKTSAMVLTVPADYSSANLTGLSFTSIDANPVLTSIQVSGAVSREIPLHGGAERKAALASTR